MKELDWNWLKALTMKKMLNLAKMMVEYFPYPSHDLRQKMLKLEAWAWDIQDV